MIKTLFKSIAHASRGLKYACVHEHNIRIQVVVALLVLLLMVVFPLTRTEQIIIFFMIVCVLVLELLNTVIEICLDILKPRLSYQVQVAKDVMAGAVLLGAMSASLIGLFIFFPYVVELVKKW